MVDRKLGFVASAKVDKGSFAATKKEFRDAEKALDSIGGAALRTKRELEKLDNLQKKGLLSGSQAGARRGQVRREQIASGLGQVGLGRFAGAVTNPFAAGAAALVFSLDQVRRSLDKLDRTMAEAREIGADPNEIERIRRALVVQGGIDRVQADAISRGLASTAARRRLDPTEFAADELARIQRIQAIDPEAARRRAARTSGRRTFGTIDQPIDFERPSPFETNEIDKLLVGLRRRLSEGIRSALFNFGTGKFGGIRGLADPVVQSVEVVNEARADL